MLFYLWIKSNIRFRLSKVGISGRHPARFQRGELAQSLPDIGSGPAIIDASDLGCCQLHPTPGHPLRAKRFLSLLWRVDSIVVWVSKISILCPYSFPHLELIPPAAVISY